MGPGDVEFATMMTNVTAAKRLDGNGCVTLQRKFVTIAASEGGA